VLQIVDGDRLRQAAGHFATGVTVITSISPDGEPYDVARSRDFSWRRTEPPPPADAIVAAREELLQKLVNDGWEKHAPGESWYAGRYKRWNSGEPRDKLEQEAAPTLVPANGQAGKSYASQI